MFRNKLRDISEDMAKDEILEEAVIVAAHPDDEILWFSSILEKVNKIYICYVHQESKPEWTRGRTEALTNYPLPHMHSMNLHLSDVFGCGDWQNPRLTPFGLDIRGRGCSQEKYEDNYRSLKNELTILLRPYKHVFTHNPWGEYGHEEHVQVFRAVEALRSQMGFSLWVSNYVSNRSMPLMVNSLERLDHGHFCRPVNRQLAAQIKDLYLRHACWTWYSDYTWPDEDGFLKVISVDKCSYNPGQSFPLTFINIGEVTTASLRNRRTEKLFKSMRHFRNRLLKRRLGFSSWSDN